MIVFSKSTSPQEHLSSSSNSCSTTPAAGECPKLPQEGCVANPRYFHDDRFCDAQTITVQDRPLKGFYNVQESPKPGTLEKEIEQASS